MKSIVIFAALSGFVAVALGALAAHGLKATLEPRLLAAFQTGVQYQMYHALALLGIVALMQFFERSWLLRGAICFVLGTLFFSGSLYALALGGPTWVGPITPLGGVAFLCGWLCIFMSALRTKTH